MAKLGKGRMPPSDGGSKYHFPVAPNVVIRGATLDELRDNIFAWRLRAGVDAGDIVADINAYYCEKWPTFCHDDGAGITPSAQAQSQDVMNRVTQWVSGVAQRMPRGGYPLEIQTIADERAAICAACPQNKTWRSGCGGCDAATLALIQQVKSLRRTAKDGNLGGCMVAGFDNSAAAWLPVTATKITDAQRAAMPEACWRKKLS